MLPQTRSTHTGTAQGRMRGQRPFQLAPEPASHSTRATIMAAEPNNRESVPQHPPQNKFKANQCFGAATAGEASPSHPMAHP
jgi:hypothetical protein